MSEQLTGVRATFEAISGAKDLTPGDKLVKLTRSYIAEHADMDPVKDFKRALDKVGELYPELVAFYVSTDEPMLHPKYGSYQKGAAHA
jgi:hypothetical protein